jgi:hypothetical protein
MYCKQCWLSIFLSLPIFLIAGTMAPVFSQPMLKMVHIEAESKNAVKRLAGMGLDIAAVRKIAVQPGEQAGLDRAYRVEAVISALDEIKLKKAGIAWSAAQQAVSSRAMATTAVGETVYHSFDEPDLGIRDRLLAIAKAHPRITRLETIGYSIQGRPMLAMRLAKGGNRHHRNDKGNHWDDAGRRPQVLFVATHHAREWVATQMAMRLITYLTDNYRTDSRGARLLNTTEIWVIPVANPDGYEYTFTNERLWRKNLRDNDGDGEITLADGVDLNRNFASHWGYDDEGSSGIPSDGTYRGTAPQSEPETQALVDFMGRMKFRFAVSYHTYGNLILYPWGWQFRTPSFDDPVFVAQAGTDDNPAIHDSLNDVGYDPGVGADLYITNGDFTDWAYTEAGVPSHTVEFTDGYDFRFPDDEAMVQTVFEDSLAFALAIAESAQHPSHPDSPVDIPAEEIYHTPVTASWGPGQIIEVIGRKRHKPKLYYQVNGGGWRKTRLRERFGRFYNQAPGLFYTRYVGEIRGQHADDTVVYKITSHESQLGPYQYKVKSDSGNPILVVAAEDYTGEYPEYTPPTGPNYLHYYTEALDQAGYAYDVWDVDKDGVPSFADVLSHYNAAIWYTGDDFAPTMPNGFETHAEECIAFRDYLNYAGGKLFATGQDLAWVSAVYGQFEEIPDDFFQYYLGAFMDIDTGGMDMTLDPPIPFDVKGEVGDPVFGGLAFSLQGDTGAENQQTASTFLATSYFLPHFEDAIAARYDRPGGPFDPYSGDYYVYSQMADQAFKRLGRTVTLPTDHPQLTFWISYDIETDWDFAFVEISEVGSNKWTTLPDRNGLTTANTGESCASGWVDQIHPFLANYMDAACEPSGATGQWNAFTGNSSGWQQAVFDLSAYAGSTVEIYISYASDWSTQNLGVFVDDIEISGQAIEDFETGLGDWTVSTAPGSGAFNNWSRITGAGFPEGPVMRTADAVYMGFGFEAIDTIENRTAVMDRVMQYFLPNP